MNKMCTVLFLVSTEFLLECTTDPEVEIGSFCWLDANRMVFLSESKKTFYVLHIDFGENACNSSVLRSGNSISGFSCNERNEVYFIEDLETSIKIINVDTGHKRTWQPYDVALPDGIAMNKDFIIIQEKYSPNIYIFGRDEKFFDKRNVGGHGFIHHLSDISQDGTVVLLDGAGIHMVTHNIENDKTVDVQLLFFVESIHAIPSMEIISCSKTGWLHVYSMTGEYKRYISYDLSDGEVSKTFAVMPWEDKPAYMAIKTKSNTTNIRIYLLSTSPKSTTIEGKENVKG